MSRGSADSERERDRSATILICEDEPSLRELMRIALDGDYAFAEVGDGLEAAELVRELKPDLVLLDLMLPGQSGLEVLKQMREEPGLRKTPVIVVSAFSGEAERRDAAAAGADRFLSKPFDPNELTATAEELLARRR